MEKKVILVINEQHKLLEQQREIMEDKFGNWEVLSVPATGWTLKEQDDIANSLVGNVVVFASPIPYLVKRLSLHQGYWHDVYTEGDGTEVYVFHNDQREKKELPDGRVIFTVAKTGWQLV